MRNLKKISFLIVLSLVVSSSIFALDWDDFDKYSIKAPRRGYSTQRAEVVATPLSEKEQNILKSFVALVITTDDAEDFDDDGVFVLQRGVIRKRKLRGVDTFSISNATYVPYSDRRTIFADKINGTVAYEDDEGIYTAELSAVFPKIDNAVHTLEFNVMDRYAPYYGANAKLDGKSIVLNSDTIHTLMLGGYEIAMEYLFW